MNYLAAKSEITSQRQSFKLLIRQTLLFDW